jgi:3-hydroxyacyl-[acyl-carrier-protein] dehydratase
MLPVVSMDNEILKYIPQRPPFLFIEKIIEKNENSLTTSLFLSGKEEYFKGHFPSKPVMPGVLLCESAFQTGALLMSMKGQAADQNKTALVTRIQNAKFKNMALPGETLLIKVDFIEMMGPAAFMKAKISTTDKTIMTIEFACTLVEE